MILRRRDVNFSSDDIIIEDGVLTKCNVYGDVLDLKKLVNDKVIPDFYEIGTEAFKDSSIKELILPDSVRRIEKYALYNCSKLRKVETKAEYLGRSAFEGCFSLKEFSDSYVKELDEMVFTGCTSFETADFTKVTEIPAYAFTDCRKLKNESFCFENILLAGEKAFSRSGISGTVDMSSVKWLGSAAFSETALREITLSDSIEYLPSELFYNCSSLMKISAPSVTKIYDKALALEKNVLSAETADETDIDFSKVTYLGLEDTFSGFVFDRPVSFDSLSGYLSLSSISGAYGELLSFPNVETVSNDYTFYANLSADAVCFESVKSLDLEHSCCPCFIGVGDSLESIRIDWDDPDVWICSLNDNPDVADVLKQERVLYHKPSELYLSEIRTEVFSVYPWHLSAVIPGEHLTYSYTVTSCETGEAIRSVEDSDYPVNFVPLFKGDYIVDTEIKDHSGNTVFSESIQVSQPGYYYETAETDSQIIIDNIDPDTEYCDIVSFTPESDGEYWLEYSGIAVNIYTKEGLLLTDYDNSEKLSLKGGETYITEITTDDPVIYISFMSSQTDLKNINTALWNGEAYAFSDSEGEIYTEVFLYDRTMLTEGVDYRTIISELYYEHYEVTVIGMGEYYGIYQFSYDLLPLAKLNSRTDTKQYSVDFIPEKSGIYKIMFMPSEEAMENAVAENSCLADFNLECDVICYNDDPNGFDYLQEYTVTGQSEISVYLNEGFRYKLYNFCLNYVTIQQVIITDKPSLSQCDAEYTFSYELNGESVYPDIRFTYRKGSRRRYGLQTHSLEKHRFRHYVCCCRGMRRLFRYKKFCNGY